MEVKKDCFAYNDNRFECNALVEMRCDKCKFYKTKKQIIDEKYKTEQRLLKMYGKKDFYNV